MNDPTPSTNPPDLVGSYVQSFVDNTMPALQTLMRIANAIEKPVPREKRLPQPGEEVPPAVTTLLKDGVSLLNDLLSSLQSLSAVLAASGIGPVPKFSIWGPEDVHVRMRAEWQRFPGPNVSKYLSDALGATLDASTAIADVYKIIHEPQPTADLLGNTVHRSALHLTESINTMMMSFRLLRGY